MHSVASFVLELNRQTWSINITCGVQVSRARGKEKAREREKRLLIEGLRLFPRPRSREEADERGHRTQEPDHHVLRPAPGGESFGTWCTLFIFLSLSLSHTRTHTTPHTRTHIHTHTHTPYTHTHTHTHTIHTYTHTYTRTHTHTPQIHTHTHTHTHTCTHTAAGKPV